MISLHDLKQGATIKNSKRVEPVSVDSAEEESKFVILKGSTIHSRQYINQIIPLIELQDIEIEYIDLAFFRKTLEGVSCP